MKSKNLASLLFLGLSLAASSFLHATTDVVPLPDGLELQWDEVPVLDEGGQHATMVINGLWRFQPGNPDVDVASALPEDQWSHIWVPGSWHTRPYWNETGLVADGDTPLWKRYIENHREWPLGWFEREIRVPESWAGRAVYVNFTDISTRAQVWLDGDWCGALETTSGRVDLTEYIRPGEPQLLRIQVLAVPPSEPILFLQGEATEQIILKPARLSQFGLVWDVELVSEPIGPNLEDLRLITSVSEGTFTIEGSLDEELAGSAMELFVQVEDLQGRVIESFDPAELSLGDESEFGWSVDWLADRLWDIDDPYLMNARIRATGEGWEDERIVRFGFREFEVRGKEFYLNGTAVRMRPVPHVDMPLITEVIEQWMEGIKSIGFNMLMVHHGRGPDIMINAADELGILVFAEVPEIKNFVVRGTWEENREAWRDEMAETITEYFNHPAIVMWWSGFNVFAHGEDQNPARIGQFDKMLVKNDEWERRAKIGWEAMDLMRAEDQTRGVYSHNGSIVGDIQTTNVYLCLIPLQEREEWLSEWSAKGEMPMLACEFGLPLDNTFMRGRAGGGWTSIGQGKNAKGSANSAMMLTEYAAVYLGPEAYELQNDDYADGIIESHFEGFIHDRNLGLGGWDSKGVDPLKRMIRSEAYQRLQVLFTTNTFRSWRTWGMTGGVNPWAFTGHAYVERSWRKNLDNMPLGPFKPGTRGRYRPEISESLYYNYREGGWKIQPAGEAILANNQELLVWIGGDEEQGFTDKDHQYYSGQDLSKQAIFINDKRDPVTFVASWIVEVAGEEVGQGRIEKTVDPGSNAFAPFMVRLPQEVGTKREGAIILTTEAAGESLTDTFEFTVYPLSHKKEEVVVVPGGEAEAEGDTVMLIEGDGSTRSWLENLGSEVTAWDESSEWPLIIGRGAIESGGIDWNAVRDWVHSGGVLILSSPNPEWVQNNLGMRITPNPSRRVYPTSQPHPISEGFDWEDLRDWNGSSTTVDGYPEYSSTLAVSGDKPYHGWRWGNRGSVASFMIEKPHHADWRPIFEGEFDLAFSPLMEIPFGEGRVLLSTFDLEDNVGVTPAADLLAGRLVDYAGAMYGASVPKGFVYYQGQPKWKHIFGKMGAYMTEDPDKARVIVLGRDHGMSDSEISRALESGKNVLLLRGARLPEFSGWSWDTSAEDFYGTTEVPVWPETSGLSISDFHSRAPYPFWRIEGPGAVSEGMLAREEVGNGVLMATAFDPTWIRSDQQPFMRLTGWRQSRNLVSMIAGMGGGFELDDQIFEQESLPTGKIPLEGEWQLKWINPLPAAATINDKHLDEGISEAAIEALTEDAMSADGWISYEVPSDADLADESQGNVDGEFVIRRKVFVPESWANDDLILNLGRVDDHDTTFWNGQEIGSTGIEHPSPWSATRIYRIPAELVEPGENILSIRVMDLFGGSGISSREHPANLIRPDDKNLQFYHPDYRRDFAYGDDPYRYYRW